MIIKSRKFQLLDVKKEAIILMKDKFGLRNMFVINVYLTVY